MAVGIDDFPSKYGPQQCLERKWKGEVLNQTSEVKKKKTGKEKENNIFCKIVNLCKTKPNVYLSIKCKGFKMPTKYSRANR